jgi:hypothetical protein
MRTGGLSPRRAVCASDQGDSSVRVSVRSAACQRGGTQVQQARGRGQQAHAEVAPVRFHQPAGLALQAGLRLGFLLQHVVEHQHEATLHLLHQPGRRLQGLPYAVEDLVQKGSGGLSPSPDY